jgi:DNA-binding transcriptional regulator YiaG
MTNLASMLKGEITRLARKEIRTQLSALRKTTTKQRQDIAVLRRQLADQQRVIATLRRSTGKVPTATDTEPTTARFSAKGLKSLRARLGLSAADLGKLIGVTGQSVYNWEMGKTTPRPSQKAAIAGLRSLGKREALGRLEALNA